ncbi:MAG: hypothetical protein OEX00_03250 [Gammaproteobacteria bacterium]|nr:hypothetical protein [Gammaproteobacteria bacterium]MDH5691921.1 hypothetical protein [Gammaproteobacteria bacterium]
MNNLDSLIIVSLFWALYGFAHSLLANNRVKHLLITKGLIAGKNYRLYYCILALALLLPYPVLTHFLPSEPLWHWPVFLDPFLKGLSIFAILIFLWTFRYYNLLEFLGIYPESVREHFTLSPIHRFVRHPWYGCALILIWSRDLDNISLVSALCLTLYILIGYRFEEKRLISEFGEAYSIYKAKVPALFPLPWKHLSVNTAAQIQELMINPPNK